MFYNARGEIIPIDQSVSEDAIRLAKADVIDKLGKRVEHLESLDNTFVLPVLRLTGDTSQMTKDKAVNLIAEYSDGVRSFTCIAKTKWQGQTSLSFPKKNYNIKFIDSSKNKVMLSFKNWYLTNGFHLKANYGDPDMTRNVVGVQLGRKIYPDRYPNDAFGVVDSFPCILYINNEWIGCYTWNLSQDENLFAMDTTNPDQCVFRPDNTGWEVANFELRCPEDQTAHHIDLLTRMVNWTKTCTNEEFVQDIEDYFDLNSLIYYWLMMDIGCAGDSMVNNSTWATWDGQKWYVIWYDLDIIFGINSDIYTPTTDLIALSKTTQWAHKYNPVWDKLYANFYNELCEVYAELRETYFPNVATIIKYFTDYSDKWGAENIAAENQKWAHSHTDERFATRSNWITARLAYCDSKYGYTP